MIGLLSLVTQGARAYARGRSHQEFLTTSRELRAAPEPELLSTTAPVHGEHLEAIRAALVAAAPSGWSVAEEDDLTTVTGPSGPALLVEVEKPGCSSRRGRCDELSSRGFPTYWLVAPVGPMITVLTLSEGQYEETTRINGVAYAATEPFAVTVPLQAG